MVGIVIVSHSSKIAEGTRDLALQMAGPEVRIITAGGMADGEIGTDASRICSAIREAESGDGVVIMVDLGSAVLSSNLAMELLALDSTEKIRIADAPLVEGTICAAVQAYIGAPIAEVVGAAEEARGMEKL